MSARLNAVRIGVRRWHEFVIGLRSPQDQSGYLMMGLGALAMMRFNRDEPMGATTLTLPQVALPSLLAGIVLFDRAVPTDPGRWGLIGVALLLGTLANLPLGSAIGSLVPRIQQVTTWGMLPIVVLAWISGVFGDRHSLWPWVQVLAQTFPMSWLAHLMRYACLPEAAAVGELSGVWWIGPGIAVLATWAVVGSALATPLVWRMARRQCGAADAEARDRAAHQLVR